MPRIKVIKIDSTEYDAEDKMQVQLGIEILVWDGTAGVTTQFYMLVGSLIELAENLLNFPSSLQDTIKKDFICVNVRGDAYSHLSVSLRDNFGNTVLEFVVKQDGSPLGKEFQVNAYIAFLSEVASINEFGRKLLFWINSDSDELEHEFWSDFYIPSL